MGINEHHLLRMLEPALRPGANLPHAQDSPSSKPPPIETRSFESILDEAQQMAGKLPDWSSIEKALAAASRETEQKQIQQTRAASGLLAELQRIENASLTRMLGALSRTTMSQRESAMNESRSMGRGA